MIWQTEKIREMSLWGSTSGARSRWENILKRNLKIHMYKNFNTKSLTKK